MLTTDATDLDRLRWDRETGEFYYPQGKQKVSKPRLFSILRQEGDRMADRLNRTVNRLLNGELSLANWQRETARQIKEDHVRMARLGRGGSDRTFAYHYLQVGNHLRTVEYPALRKFAEDIRDGKLSEAQIRDRVRKYGYSAKASFERANLSAKEDRGDRWGRRRLGGCLNHCQPCINYASMGILPIAKIVPPGTKCDCGGRCCCSVETFRDYPQ